MSACESGSERVDMGVSARAGVSVSMGVSGWVGVSR